MYFTHNFLSFNFTMKEKEKLYVELKHILARQPGPEAAEQLQQCQWIIRDRTKKLKVLCRKLQICIICLRLLFDINNDFNKIIYIVLKSENRHQHKRQYFLISILDRWHWFLTSLTKICFSILFFRH